MACGAASFQIWRTEGSVLPIMMPPKTMLINSPGSVESTGTAGARIRLQPLVTSPRNRDPASKIRKPAITLAGMWTAASQGTTRRRSMPQMSAIPSTRKRERRPLRSGEGREHQGCLADCETAGKSSP